MRLRVKQYVALLAVLAFTVPAFARTFKQEMTADKGMTIGTTSLKAGSYQLSADDSKKELNVLQNGKMVATIQGQWVKLPQKPQYSTIISDGAKITQVQFGGDEQAFQVQ